MALDGAGRRAAVLAATVMIAGCSSGGRARPAAGAGHRPPAGPAHLIGEPPGDPGRPVLSDDFGGTRLDTRQMGHLQRAGRAYPPGRQRRHPRGRRAPRARRRPLQGPGPVGGRHLAPRADLRALGGEDPLRPGPGLLRHGVPVADAPGRTGVVGDRLRRDPGRRPQERRPVHPPRQGRPAGPEDDQGRLHPVAHGGRRLAARPRDVLARRREVLDLPGVVHPEAVGHAPVPAERAAQRLPPHGEHAAQDDDAGGLDPCLPRPSAKR